MSYIWINTHYIYCTYNKVIWQINKLIFLTKEITMDEKLHFSITISKQKYKTTTITVIKCVYELVKSCTHCCNQYDLLT